MKARDKYSHVKAKVDTNLLGRKWPQAPLKKTQMKQAVKADEERPLSTYVQAKTDEEKSGERENGCKKVGFIWAKLSFRKLQNLPVVKYKADEYEEEKVGKDNELR